MSATNHTSTIELSQYVSTDKPTYLTDYNGDMLKIDNAIAADRDSISTAQNKANTADGKADANKLSIDTLNAQINGDPTDPSDTGLAGKVTDNSGDIDTIEALLGNGTPTTSNQTVIGAINGLEGAIAPREDGDTLANSYAEGEQFARGGSVYTALTSLTSGTAFASLTLNTDYKNSDTLVEQIASLAEEIPSEIGHAYLGQREVRVVADGVKTYSALLDELFAAYNVARTEYGKYCAPYSLSIPNFAVMFNPAPLPTENLPSISFNYTYTMSAGVLGNTVVAKTSGSTFYASAIVSTPAVTITDNGSVVPDDGTTISLYYNIYT